MAATIAGACDRAPEASREEAAGIAADTALVLRLTLEDPARGVGVIEVRGTGQAVFYRTGIGERREARLEPGEVLHLKAALRPELCAIVGDSGTGLVTRLKVEARWPDLACMVRLSEAAWRTEPASDGVRRALDDLERRVCRGPCPLDFDR